MKAKKGDIRPVYQQVGWEVCKVAADNEDNEVWVPAEKLIEAETLSTLYKQENK